GRTTLSTVRSAFRAFARRGHLDRSHAEDQAFRSKENSTQVRAYVSQWPNPFSVAQRSLSGAILRHMKVEENRRSCCQAAAGSTRPLPALVHRIRGGPHQSR